MIMRKVVFLVGLLFAFVANAGPPSTANPMASFATGTSKFADYFLEPSAGGQLDQRNVIVWAPSGGDCHVARVYFNNTQGIKVDTPSGPIAPDQIFVWQMVCGGPASPTFRLEYITALPAAGFEEALGIQIREDRFPVGSFDGPEDFDQPFGYRFRSRSDSLVESELNHAIESYEDEFGTHLIDNNWSRHLSPLGESITVNGMTFEDVVVTNFLGFDRIRFHAKGIGPVREVGGSMNADPRFGGQSSRDVIFYRVDGAQAGSVGGTPFVGLSNPWFEAP